MVLNLLPLTSPEHRHRRRRAPLFNHGDGQTQNRPHMQGKFRQWLPHEGDHTGIVRSRRDFAKNNVVPTHKKLYTKQPVAPSASVTIRATASARARATGFMGWGCQDSR